MKKKENRRNKKTEEMKLKDCKNRERQMSIYSNLNGLILKFILFFHSFFLMSWRRLTNDRRDEI